MVDFKAGVTFETFLAPDPALALRAAAAVAGAAAAAM